MIRLKVHIFSSCTTEVTTFSVSTGDSVVPAMTGFQSSKKQKAPYNLVTIILQLGLTWQ